MMLRMSTHPLAGKMYNIYIYKHMFFVFKPKRTFGEKGLPKILLFGQRGAAWCGIEKDTPSINQVDGIWVFFLPKFQSSPSRIDWKVVSK